MGDVDQAVMRRFLHHARAYAQKRNEVEAVENQIDGLRAKHETLKRQLNESAAALRNEAAREDRTLSAVVDGVSVLAVKSNAPNGDALFVVTTVPTIIDDSPRPQIKSA